MTSHLYYLCMALLLIICVNISDKVVVSSTIPLNVNNYSIPMLSVSLNYDKDHYLRHLLYSIDYPIDSIHIQIGNSDPAIVQRIVDDIKFTQATSPFQHLNIVVSTMNYNPGSAKGFNFGLRSMLKSSIKPPWIIIVNNDIAFKPGVLRYVATSVYNELQMNAKFGIGFMNLCCGGEWSAVVFTRQMVERVGLFDENFYPAYYEDDDYGIRIHLAQFQAIRLPYANLTHGGVDGSKKYISGVENILMGKRKVLNATQMAWRRCFRQGIEYSREYIRDKWNIKLASTTIKPVCKTFRGINRMCKVGYTNPFGDLSKDISYWKLNQSRHSYLIKIGNGTMIPTKIK